MKMRERKTKGQEFQKKIVQRLRTRFNLDFEEVSCFEGDIQANPMGQKGIDIKLSPLAQVLIPFDIEAKRQETTQIFKWIEQAESNAGKGRIPLVVFRRNRSKTYCVLKLDALLNVME